MIQCGARTLTFQLIEGAFAKTTPALRIGREENHLAILVDFWKTAAPERVKWPEVGDAYLAFTFSIDDADVPKVDFRRDRAVLGLRWGDLELTGATTVGEIKAQDAAFTESRGGRPVASARLG